VRNAHVRQNISTHPVDRLQSTDIYNNPNTTSLLTRTFAAEADKETVTSWVTYSITVAGRLSLSCPMYPVVSPSERHCSSVASLLSRGYRQALRRISNDEDIYSI